MSSQWGSQKIASGIGVSWTHSLLFCFECVFNSVNNGHIKSILALCETNLDDSNDSANFSVTSYIHLIWKDSVTYMHVLAVYVKEKLPFAEDLSLENSTGW